MPDSSVAQTVLYEANYKGEMNSRQEYRL